MKDDLKKVMSTLIMKRQRIMLKQLRRGTLGIYVGRSFVQFDPVLGFVDDDQFRLPGVDALTVSSNGARDELTRFGIGGVSSHRRVR